MRAHASPPSSPRVAREIGAPRKEYSAVLATVLALALLGICAKLKMLGPLDRLHAFGLALGALQLQHDLLRGLGLLVEHGLRLTAETFLFFLVAPVTLGLAGLFARLVLRDLVGRVLLALPAVGVPGLRDVDH